LHFSLMNPATNCQ